MKTISKLMIVLISIFMFITICIKQATGCVQSSKKEVKKAQLAVHIEPDFKTMTSVSLLHFL